MRRMLLMAGLFLAAANPGLMAQGHHITVRLTGWKDTLLLLGNYYGTKTYIYDSAHLNHNGVAVFSGAQPIPEGIYFVLMPDRHKFFQMLIGQSQDFSVEADTADLLAAVTFNGSPDNALFSDYNHFLKGINDRSMQQAAELRSARTAQDSAKIRQDQKTMGEEIFQYRKKVIAEHPQSLLAEIFRGMLDPDIPPAPRLPDGKLDSSFAFQYAGTHYWDNINFRDSALLRTPIYETRLQNYFAQYVPPFPDSINGKADMLLARARANNEMFKFTLWWLTYNFETSKYMGMDAVFVHLVEKYYVPGDAYWLTKDQNDKIIERAYTLAPNLIGEKAPPLDLLDSSMAHRISLYDIQAKYTLLVFWDPTCGHCQVEVPKMDSAYRASWERLGVRVLAIRTGGTKEQWTQFIADHHLGDWINAWDPANQSDYRRLYDVYMTPVVYLLDRDKKIIAKMLGVTELSDFLRHESKTTASGT